MTNKLKSSVMALTCMAACGQTVHVSPDTDNGAVAVWNQAYQENYDADTLADITKNARNAYVLLDPFMDNASDAATVAAIKANGNQVAAYISIGTGEDWRDDFADLRPHLVDQQWGDWAGEYFISTPNDAVLSIMKARIDRIATLGFDWVEFDNMDWTQDDDYRAEYGFVASIEDGTRYYQDLCEYVRAKGMKCMAKSTVENADMFDGVTYESYADDKNWWDQGAAARFLSQGKLVVIVHYDETDCAGVYANYVAQYGPGLSFICETPARNGYVHFNL